ncbi:DUF72 domain-containing protein [Caldimonas sp. KR1-144]|uniref:DUF72 domain-containing protein n=1 Tax=Caldimonas sp. KR1-144 TaxID=3400911 RepID=UPI003C1092A7
MSERAGAASVRVGIGGWNYEPWRANFYPQGWPQARELEYASRRLTAIEINSTFYSSQKPATFAKWREQTPEGFVFSVKASQYATHRRVLAEAGESVRRFVDGGLAELGDKLGPIVWQFDRRKAFDADDFAAFLKLLPAEVQGRELRHALDVRHESFACEAFYELARRHRAAIVFSDGDGLPAIPELTAGFFYARLLNSRADLATGYAPDVLDSWAAGARAWAPREGYVFFINGAKERAPAAAMALIERIR